MGNNREHHVLDEPFLMKHHRLKNPSDPCSVNISSQNLASAKEDDFEKFDCVTFINAAEDLLTLEPFRKFPGLRELELSLNGLRNLKITAGEFLHLEIDVCSFPNLRTAFSHSKGVMTANDVSHLSLLEHVIKEPFCIYSSPQLKFPSLEVLSLDDNHLSDPSVFVSLSRLRRLKEPNVARNRISAAPYLHQAERRHFLLHPELDHNSFGAQWYRSLSSLWRQARPSQQESMEVPEELEAKKAFSSPLEGRGKAVMKRHSFCHGSVLRASTQLLYLQVAAEAALLPGAFLPSLKELTFHSNPLSSTRSGTPGVGGTVAAGEGAGRGSPTSADLAPPAQPGHQTCPTGEPSHGEVAPLHPAQSRPQGHVTSPPGQEAAADAGSSCQDLPDAPAPAQPLLPSSSMIPPSSQRVVLGEEEGGSRSPGSDEGDVASFTTQVGDVSRPLQRPGPGARLEKRSEKREEGRSQGVPEQYKGYEELLSGDTDPELTEPVGIHKNAQALYQVLDHPLLRDAKARLDWGQKPYVPREKVKSWSSKGRLFVSGSGSTHVCGRMLRA
ncbi:LOW QUALITY PROTEIN: X-ray radiation resistance-associated protein 1 [Ara ararauna]